MKTCQLLYKETSLISAEFYQRALMYALRYLHKHLRYLITFNSAWINLVHCITTAELNQFG